MLGFLVTISLILNFVAFFLIILLFQRTSAKHASFDEERVEREIEDILLSFSEEMKDENKKLMQELIKISPSNKKPITREKQGVSENVSKESILQEEKLEPSPSYLPPIDEVKDVYESSYETKAVLLAEEGHSVEEIAKQLKKGKGEIELLLKFHKKS